MKSYLFWYEIHTVVFAVCMYFVISFITIQLPFSEIFDGEVLVPVKGAEAVEFLSRKVSCYNHSGIVLPLLQTS